MNFFWNNRESVGRASLFWSLYTTYYRKARQAQYKSPKVSEVSVIFIFITPNWRSQINSNTFVRVSFHKEVMLKSLTFYLQQFKALNQLFEKIMALDIDERHLLRLGHGEEALETEKDFSRSVYVLY